MIEEKNDVNQTQKLHIQKQFLESDETLEQAMKKFHVKKVKFALSTKQIKELLNVAYNNNAKHWIMIKLQLQAGMRISEICYLRIEQINFIENEIILEAYQNDRYCQSWNPKTISGNRLIPINNEIGKEIKRYIKPRKKGYVFLSRKKKTNLSPGAAINMINKYAKESKSIGKNIGSHALRRTFASNMAKEKISIGKLSKILGHKDIKTTMLYLYDIVDKDFDDVRKAVKKMME